MEEECRRVEEESGRLQGLQLRLAEEASQLRAEVARMAEEHTKVEEESGRLQARLEKAVQELATAHAKKEDSREISPEKEENKSSRDFPPSAQAQARLQLIPYEPAANTLRACYSYLTSIYILPAAQRPGDADVLRACY